MRSLLLISALQVLASAIPYLYASEDATTPAATLITLSGILPTSTVATPDSTSLNIPVTAVPDPDDDDNDDSDETDADGNPISRTKKPHKEPIPVFTKQCQCQLATARYPCWATDALQRCYFEENFSHACYMQAAGGCPRPTRACGKLYKPTPRPGPNPCELAPNPHVTSAPHIITNFPTLTGAPNVTLSLPVVPTKNNTFTTMTTSGTL